MPKPSLRNITFSIFLLLPVQLLISQSASKPFPQVAQYFDLVIKPNHISQQIINDSVISFYRQWKKKYIKAGNRNGEFYISSADATANKACVSEGQGYGMTIVVLMAGTDDSARIIYDGLFLYCGLGAG
jgi:endoglucanase